jgi:hypothetical protein
MNPAISRVIGQLASLGFGEPGKPTRKGPFSGATVDRAPIWGLSGGFDNPHGTVVLSLGDEFNVVWTS